MLHLPGGYGFSPTPLQIYTKAVQMVRRALLIGIFEGR